MINNKDGKQNPKNSAPADHDGYQTPEERSSQSPKITDTPT